MSCVEDNHLYLLPIPRNPLHLNDVRPYLGPNTLNPTSTEPSPFSHPPEPVSPVPTEIATGLPAVEPMPEECRERVSSRPGANSATLHTSQCRPMRARRPRCSTP